MIWWWSRVFINKLSEGLLWHLIVTQRSQLAILSSSHNLFSKKLQSYHRIIEYPELEVMYKALQVQLLAAQRTTQNSKPVFESVVQMLSWTPALGAVPTALPLTPNCPSPDSSMPFPQALLLSQRAELSSPPCDKNHLVLRGNRTGTVVWLVFGDVHLKEEMPSAMTVRSASSNFQ